ncbi:hypothetical protein ACP70R_018610 [Stipagrostis hirtigluma subsp. patula]
MNVRRKSVHIVSRSGGLYALSRVDVSRLFYPSTAEANAAAAAEPKTTHGGGGGNEPGAMETTGPLPEPIIHYQPFRPAAAASSDRPTATFALLGSTTKILCSDAAGYTAVYDARARSFRAMPRRRWPKGPKCASVQIVRTAAHARADLEFDPWGCVDHDFFGEELRGEHADSSLAYYPVRNWRWRPLPPPPFAGVDPGCTPPDDVAFAVTGGGTKICVSSAAATYLFDTVAREWSKAGDGDWVLPIHGKAEYVPKLGVWLGMSAWVPHSLCALYLSAAAADMSGPPAMQHVRLDIDPPEEDWSPKNRALVNLGSGRFCIAKFCRTMDVSDDGGNGQVVVFTGVEVVPGGANGLSVVKHKSKCLVADGIEHVL